MGYGKALLGGALLGGALMYYGDPISGPRRRSLAKDKLRHSSRALGESTSVAVRDLSHRTGGIIAGLKSRLRERGPVDDDVLAERVRAQLGRLCAHPRAIHVQCRNGVVDLSGPILAEDVDAVRNGVRRVRGVKSIASHFEVHEIAGDHPALQGGHTLRDQRGLQWNPSTRLFAQAGGAALFLYGLRNRSVLSCLAGLGAFSKASATPAGRRAPGTGAGRSRVEVQKTIHVEAPLDEVFCLLSNPENFPRFMSHVKEVRLVGPDCYRWSVQGPAGLCFGWNAEVTACEPNCLISWKSIPGSGIENEGRIRLELDGAGTRIDLHMSYHPPVGMLGHGIAKFLGGDPKHLLDDDLLRLKSLLENGRTTGPHGKISVDDLSLRASPRDAAAQEDESRVGPFFDDFAPSRS